jgi:hypothetical protein
MKWFHMAGPDATRAMEATWEEHGATYIYRASVGRDTYVQLSTEEDAAKYRAECARLGVPYEETDERADMGFLESIAPPKQGWW